MANSVYWNVRDNKGRFITRRSLQRRIQRQRANGLPISSRLSRLAYKGV